MPYFAHAVDDVPDPDAQKLLNEVKEIVKTDPKSAQESIDLFATANLSAGMIDEIKKFDDAN